MLCCADCFCLDVLSVYCVVVVNCFNDFGVLCDLFCVCFCWYLVFCFCVDVCDLLVWGVCWFGILVWKLYLVGLELEFLVIGVLGGVSLSRGGIFQDLSDFGFGLPLFVYVWVVCLVLRFDGFLCRLLTWGNFVWWVWGYGRILAILVVGWIFFVWWFCVFC